MPSLLFLLTSTGAVYIGRQAMADPTFASPHPVLHGAEACLIRGRYTIQSSIVYRGGMEARSRAKVRRESRKEHHPC